MGADQIACPVQGQFICHHPLCGAVAAGDRSLFYGSRDPGPGHHREYRSVHKVGDCAHPEGVWTLSHQCHWSGAA